ncbi:MAG: hypothetical protein JWL83_147 [Actinomycetia bacterium]|nr:hypothetical protein [Actinomycetes bacterium]
MFIAGLNLAGGGNVSSKCGFGTEFATNEEGEMTDCRTWRARRDVVQTSLHLWSAPPRNHDWIAARIGRG